MSRLGRMAPGKMARLEQYQPGSGGSGNGLGAALGAQLAHDGVDVKLDGMLADVEIEGNGLVC